MSVPQRTANTLRLTPKRSHEEPHGMRFVDRRGRYILQELVRYPGVDEPTWRDVPFIGSETPAVIA